LQVGWRSFVLDCVGLFGLNVNMRRGKRPLSVDCSQLNVRTAVLPAPTR